jgi:hypothetical protein
MVFASPKVLTSRRTDAGGKRQSRQLLILAAMLSVGGCQKPAIKPQMDKNGSVAFKAIVPYDAARYTLEPGETAIQPKLLTNVAPDYPRSLLATSLPPVEVVAQVVVALDGRVSQVLIRPYLGDSTNREKFNEEVRKAVLGWTFEPLRIQHWSVQPDGTRALATVSQPCSLWYIFRFEVVDGHAKTTVRTSE